MAAKKKKPINVEGAKSSLPSKVIKAIPAVLIAPPESNDDVIETPTKALEGYELEDAPGGLIPTVEFSQPGAFVFGKYLGARTLKIGERNQTMYDLEVDGSPAAVWGSTIIDSRIMRLNPQIGDELYIQYCGDVETKRGLKPAKNFRIARMKLKGESKK